MSCVRCSIVVIGWKLKKSSRGAISKSQRMGGSVLLLILALSVAHSTAGIDLKTTQVFVLPILPSMFNWNATGNPDDFVFRPSLSGAPDLPSWVHYTFSHRYASGYLYGVPPNEPGEVQLEVIGMNRQTYSTGRMLMDMDIQERGSPAKNEVQLKIDNLNLEDLFDPRNQSQLMDIFRLHLWPRSKDDLYVTFLASAVELGARLPLRPAEGEGVVIRLGSRARLSESLRLLQQEVAPLRTLSPCPRDFKRTTVERVFRDRNFTVDWCSFRLLPSPEGDGVASGLGGSNNGAVSRPTQHKHHANSDHMEPSFQPVQVGDNVWRTLTRDEVPLRSYMREFALTILLPMLVMLLLVLLLSLILCFHNQGISRLGQDTAPLQMVQYSCVHRASDALRALSTRRDPTPPRPTSMGVNNNGGTLGGGSGTPFATGGNTTYPRTSTLRRSEERTPLNRPEPPPYVGSQRNGIPRRVNYSAQ